jgi:hypothetical protein
MAISEPEGLISGGSKAEQCVIPVVHACNPLGHQRRHIFTSKLFLVPLPSRQLLCASCEHFKENHIAKTAPKQQIHLINTPQSQPGVGFCQISSRLTLTLLFK